MLRRDAKLVGMKFARATGRGTAERQPTQARAADRMLREIMWNGGAEGRRGTISKMQFASCLRSLRRGWAGALRMPQFSSSIVYSGVALPLLPGRRGEIYIIPQRDQNYSIQITSQLHEAEKPGIYHLRISVDGRTAQEIIISHANGEQSVTKECTGMVSSGGEWVAPFRWKREFSKCCRLSPNRVDARSPAEIVQTHATSPYSMHRELLTR